MLTNAEKAACRQYHAKNRARRNAASRAWYYDNHARALESGRAYDARRREQPKRQADQALNWYCRAYGLTKQQAQVALVSAQGDFCACCRDFTRLHVDHDHTTGRARGMVCQNCNLMIGQAKDSPTRLEKGAEYLRTH